MFDLVLKFETRLKLKLVSKAFEELLLQCDGAIPYTEQIITHNMSLTNAYAIPDKNWIDNAANILHNATIDSLSQNDSLNVEVVETAFIGYSSVVQKEETNA